jgi:gamma-glutamylcyclotransferase
MSATPESFIVFAYGSNMLTRRLRERCPSARALGTAELLGYELKWHKRSRDESGKCDVVSTNDANDVVHGVLYEIPMNEKAALDKAEGLGHGYEAKMVDVAFNGALSKETVYYATDMDPSLKPYTWYQALVVAGAREHGLPASYVDGLAACGAVEDRDRARHDRNMELVRGHQGDLLHLNDR